jgi:hypothetical protein
MNSGPMGGSGIDLDIITGMPRKIRSHEEHLAQEELKEQKAVQEAVALSQELPTVLPIVARALENRIIELVRGDTHCQSILQIINALKVKMDVARHVATKIRRQAMGIVLTSMTDETKVAPEGIPAEDNQP